MATGNCWTLWQHLPRRCQLSTRDTSMPEDWDTRRISRSTEGPVTPQWIPKSPGYTSTNIGYHGPKLGVAPLKGYPESSRDYVDSKKLAFPQRHSRYISAMTNQQRVNSVRQNTTSDRSTTVTYVPTIRRRLSQPFPITRLSNLQRSNYEALDSASRESNAKQQSVPDLYANPKRVAVHNIFPFELSDNTTHPIRERGKKYFINELEDATMFIDNDKIIYFKKNKHYNVTQFSANATGPYSAKRDDGSYLAHLRRTYLKTPKYLPKTRNGSEINNKHIQEMRCRYDTKVGHILEYYSHGDTERDVRTTCTSEQGRRTPESRTRSGSPRGRMRSPGPGGARLRSLFSMSCGHTLQPAQGSVQRYRDSLGEWNTYLKFNQMAILHEKQFYLRTPDIGVLPHGVRSMAPDKGTNCVCRLCSEELDLSMFAHRKRTGIEMFENGSTSPKQESSSETECPGRPNSADVINGTHAMYSPSAEDRDKPDESMKISNEHLTITLPEITEENELSDVSSTVTNQNVNPDDDDEVVLQCGERNKQTVTCTDCLQLSGDGMPI